ncbi:MAG TPA: UbiD family decarboxylase [Chloroflexota bacterium]|nr:UbiD family decarboxylase [Chloroflexota bacterium]
MAYADLREYLRALEGAGKLQRIKKEVDKTWEIAAVMRRVFQRIPPQQRPAVLFESIKGHDVPLACGLLGASREIYALALETDVPGITARWDHAQDHPIDPELVATGPCKEVVKKGGEASLDYLPIPTWTVEHDPAPFLTAPFVFTKDPDTGDRNVGTYRMQLKGPRTLGLGGFHLNSVQHVAIHYRRYKELKRKMPVAVVLGADPTIGLCSVSKVPYHTDEIAVAGGLRRAPVELVQCETIDMEVPASAEFVLEGEVDPEILDEEGPFGEFPGYMGAPGPGLVFNLKAMTHRRDPIFQAFISQMPPSESSCIRGVGREMNILKHLKDVLRLPVVDVHHLEDGGSSTMLAISIKKGHETQPREIMWAVWALQPNLAKWVIVVDDDIDVRDTFALHWAMAFRVQPVEDIYIERNTLAINLDPRQAPPGVPSQDRSRLIGSKVGIDATRKFAYPPAALPPREHLEQVDRLWKEYGFNN